MKISRLLELDQKLDQSIIQMPKNLGDSFLITHNRFFRAIRQQALALGYTYTDIVDAFYLALPLSQLDLLLKTKKIPYVDNTSVLKELEKRMPQQTQWDEIVDNLKKNHVFHESCHAVAHAQALPIFQNDTASFNQVLRILIEESFANACELLGNIDINDSAHRIFYEINSYIFMYEERSLLKQLVQDLGISKALQFIMFSYLHSNFLREKMNESDLDRIVKLIKIPKSKVLKSVSKMTFLLNPRFRFVTTVFHLRLSGYKYSIKDISSFDFMKLIETDPRFLKLTEVLSRIVEDVSNQHNWE